jgi:uncharacterized protein YfaA (DUF2138 family)
MKRKSLWQKFYFCDEASVSASLTFRTVVNSMPKDGVDCVDMILENNLTLEKYKSIIH